MPTKKTPRKEKREATFDVTTILAGIADPCFLQVNATGLNGLKSGDVLLIDRARKKPKEGDFIIWQTAEGLTVDRYCKDDPLDEGEELYGIGTSLIRTFPEKAK